MSETLKTHDSNYQPLRIISSIKHYDHVGVMNGLVSFLVCEKLTVPAVVGCDFCNQSVECIYQKTRLEEAIDASIVPIV